MFLLLVNWPDNTPVGLNLFKMAVPRLGSLMLCRKFALQPTVISSTQQFSSTSSLLDVFFTKKHEWVNVEGTKGIIGVSAYAAESLGDIVYAQLPDVGSTVTAGEVRSPSSIISLQTNIQLKIFFQGVRCSGVSEGCGRFL